MPIGAVIGGTLGAIGSIGGSLITANASKTASQAQTALGYKALDTQTSLSQQGLSTLLGMFSQAKDIAQPTINTGYGVLDYGKDFINSTAGNALQTGYGIINKGLGLTDSASATLKSLLTPGSSMTDTLSMLPGFKFTQDWGQRAVANQGSTQGFGGNTLKAASDYATGTAQTYYGNYVTQLQNLLNSGISLTGTGTNTLSVGSNLASTGANIVGTGANMITSPTNALISGATNTGTTAFNNLTTTGQNIANTYTNIGNSTAAGTLGTANALSTGLTGATNSVSNALLLSKLFGNNTTTGGVYTGTAGAAAP